MVAAISDSPEGAGSPGNDLRVAYQDDPFPDLSPARRRDLLIAIEAALVGGEAARPFYRSATLTAVEKDPGDPVTAADHASNDAILSVLRDHAPEDAVLSEELPLPEVGAGSTRLWVVDPLDGTREFIDGIDEFAAMVGLAESRRAVLGAVYVVGAGQLFAGLAAGGAWVASCSSTPDGAISVGRFADLRVGTPEPGRTRFVRSRSHPDVLLQEIEDQLPGVEVIPSGSVGVKCARIAARDADLYVHPVPYLKEWDTCAPEAVLCGAGGRVTDCGGSNLEYGKLDPKQSRGILAGDPASWAAALPLVRGVAASIL
jgi:3'(2'), 5'-bisphosphate nucleotidase